MTRNFYQILEIEKTATEEQIKKAYRRLSLRWHPDKWANKPESEKKRVEEKFKEINGAYQILSDPAIRSLYDIYGEDFENFSGDNTTFDDELKREYAEAEAQKEELKKEMLTVELQGLSILMMIDEFASFLSVGESDLDPNLWTPFSNWKEKIKNLPFAEISPFREQMIRAIQEAGKNERDRSLNSVKVEAIQRIEKLLKEKAIKLENLEPNNRDYKEEINRINVPDLDKEIEAIINVEERVSEEIKLKARGSYNEGGKKHEETNHWKDFVNQTENRSPKKEWWWGRK